jgi:hypothetical protein
MSFQGLFIIAVAIGFSASAQAQNLGLQTLHDFNFHEGRIFYQADTDYFTTDANYSNDGGSFEHMPSGYSITNLTSSMRAGYDFSSDLSIFGLLNYGYTMTSDPAYDRTNSGVSDIGLGAQYILMTSPFVLIPDFEFFFPLFKIDEATDEALIGDGALSARLGTWLQKDISFFVLEGYLGFQYRDDGRSGLLKWQAGGYVPIRSFKIGASAGGYQSVLDDEFKDLPIARTRVTNRVNAGSLRYYNVNASLVEARAWLSYDFSFLSIQAFYNRSLTGENNAEGQSFGAAISFAFGGDDSNSNDDEEERPHRRTSVPSNLSSDEPATEVYRVKRIQQLKEQPRGEFEPDKTKFDQQSFKEAEMEVQMKSAKKARTVKKKKRKRTKSGTQMLNEMENSLEKKSAR